MSAWVNLHEAAGRYGWYFSSDPQTPTQGVLIRMHRGRDEIEVELTRGDQVRYAYQICHHQIQVEREVPGGQRGVIRLMRQLTALHLGM